MPHKVDLYEKSIEENDTGQSFATWYLSEEEIRCFVTPSGSAASIRVSPTAEEADYLTVMLPYDTNVSYTTRFDNFSNLYGETIYPGIFQVIQIDRHVSAITGRVEYLQLKLKSVIE